MSSQSQRLITDYFKPLPGTTLREISPSTSNQVSLNDALEAVIKQFKSKLLAEATKRGEILVMIGEMMFWEDHVFAEEWDTEDEAKIERRKRSPGRRERLLQRLDDFLKSFPYAFITKNANQNLKRISESLYMIDRRHWKDQDRCTVRLDSFKAQLVFEAELFLCHQLVDLKKFGLAADLLIALLLALKECPDGFWCCNNRSEALEILDDFGSLWQQTMHSEEMMMSERARECLNVGYIRENAIEFRMEIPYDVVIVIRFYGKSMDKRSKRAFYDLMKEESENLKQYGRYSRGFRFGEMPKDIINLVDQQAIKLDLNHASTHFGGSFTFKELKTRTIDELRDICRRDEFCPIDIAGSDRKSLIKFLIDPEAYVLNMKREYHYEVTVLMSGGLVDRGSDESIMVELQRTRQTAFDERRYLVRGGVVVEREQFWNDILGDFVYMLDDDEVLMAEALERQNMQLDEDTVSEDE